MISRTANDATRPLEYMPQLDSLRTIAVVAVFFMHFLPPENGFRAVLPWGDLGVQLFFVLSGFLITGILLSAKNRIEQAGLSPWRGIRNFYIRRFLRLFPIYYVYLAAALVMLPVARHYAPYFLFYSQNFLFAIHRDAMGTMTHFWSLAVEEQFYATWPWLMIFVPRRYLVPALLGVVLLGPVWRTAGLLAGLSPRAILMMMPAHFDTLGMGGLLAVLAATRPEWSRRLMKIGLWAGAALLAVHLPCTYFGVAHDLMLILGEVAAGLFFTWVIGRASLGVGGIVGRVLENRVLIYLGGISYGLYVIHYHVPGVLRDKLLPRLGLSLFDNDWLNFLLFSAISVVLAAASWHIMEERINGLKRYFPYASPKKVAARAEEAVAASAGVATPGR